MGNTTAWPIAEPDLMTISSQTVTARPVPNENAAHRAAPTSAMRTRLDRSANWAMGTVSSRAKAAASATIDKMPELDRPRSSRISGSSSR